MKTIHSLTVCAAVASAFSFTGLSDEKPYGPLPTPAHIEYHNREIIAIVHWGLNTYTDQEWGFGNVSPSVLKADSLDPEQWVRVMAAGGIKAVILVCKHHDGFCLWPSPLNKDYSMSAVTVKRDKKRSLSFRIILRMNQNHIMPLAAARRTPGKSLDLTPCRRQKPHADGAFSECGGDQRCAEDKNKSFHNF